MTGLGTTQYKRKKIYMNNRLIVIQKKLIIGGTYKLYVGE